MYNVNIRNLITKELEVKKINNIVDDFLGDNLQILALLDTPFKKLESITNEKGERLNFTFDFNKNIWIENLL